MTLEEKVQELTEVLGDTRFKDIALDEMKSALYRMVKRQYEGKTFEAYVGTYLNRFSELLEQCANEKGFVEAVATSLEIRYSGMLERVFQQVLEHAIEQTRKLRKDDSKKLFC